MALVRRPPWGERLEVTYEPLLTLLGLRPGSVIFPARTFNEFRLVEDRRRIAAFLHARGHFDAQVDEPALVFAPDGRRVGVT